MIADAVTRTMRSLDAPHAKAGGKNCNLARMGMASTNYMQIFRPISMTRRFVDF
jgi:hypothetical protein